MHDLYFHFVLLLAFFFSWCWLWGLVNVSSWLYLFGGGHSWWVCFMGLLYLHLRGQCLSWKNTKEKNSKQSKWFQIWAMIQSQFDANHWRPCVCPGDHFLLGSEEKPCYRGDHSPTKKVVIQTQCSLQVNHVFPYKVTWSSLIEISFFFCVHRHYIAIFYL